MSADTHPSQAVIRRLVLENEALRMKSARHEFRQLQAELSAPEPFKLDVALAEPAQPGDVAVPGLAVPPGPPLPVPEGSIQPEPLAPDLPIMAVYDDRLQDRQLAAALLGLLKTQYHAPIARLVFLCSSFEALPFLGRYGYAVEHIGQTEPDLALARLHMRFGVTQIRSLGTGALLAEHQD